MGTETLSLSSEGPAACIWNRWIQTRSACLISL